MPSLQISHKVTKPTAAAGNSASDMANTDNFKNKQKALAEAKKRSEGGSYRAVIKAADGTFWIETTSFTRNNETLVAEYEDGKKRE